VRASGFIPRNIHGACLSGNLWLRAEIFNSAQILIHCRSYVLQTLLVTTPCNADDEIYVSQWGGYLGVFSPRTRGAIYWLHTEEIHSAY
jgi:hypothetical protein